MVTINSGQNDTNNHLYTDSIRKFWWADFISMFVIDIFLFLYQSKIRSIILNQNRYLQLIYGMLDCYSQFFSLSSIIFTVYVTIVRLIDAYLASAVKFQFAPAFKKAYLHYLYLF